MVGMWYAKRKDKRANRPTDTLGAMATPLVVWDPAMLSYDFGPQHPLNPIRLELMWQLLDDLGIHLETVAPQPATVAELTRIHSAEYVQLTQDAAANPHDFHGGHGFQAADNPPFAAMHDAASLIAGGSLHAARAIARGDAARAVNIAGGLHHAMPDHAAGFCVYNDAALAIAALLDAGIERVAYVDIDVHHGDGVQQAFYHDPRVLTISLHQAPHTLWPGTGYISEIGRGAAAGSAVNIPLPVGTADADWLRAFTAVVPSLLREFRPTVLVTQHGADTHIDDPLADLALTVDGQLAAARLLRDLAAEFTSGRWLVLGGGGYEVVRVVPRSWAGLLALVVDRELELATVLPTSWVATAAAARPGVKLPAQLGDHVASLDDFARWDGGGGSDIDQLILAVRNEVFPLYGLDPVDARD